MANVTEKILVVDDSRDTREMMTKLLELESFNVITAEDGRIGFDTAKAERPDIIITDINMPNLNGIEMIRLLRGEVDFSSVPIMAITAYGQNVAQEAVEAGANEATTKPVDFNKLIRGIRQLLDSARSKRKRNGFT
jgi:DNA-binding response OmpR family regulator